MKYTDFRTQVWTHLGRYKREVLKITDNVTINGIDYEHILPKGYEKENLNLIGNNYQQVDNKLFIPSDTDKPITLHTHWSHLNSSQILCVSYFYPIINNPAELNRIIRFINDKTGMSIPEAAKHGELEYEAADKTSVDFVIYLDKGKKVYFEIKYTEENFGNASKKIKIGDNEAVDNNHYEKFQKKFHSDAHITFLDYKNNYQFVRNICLAQNENYTVFLVPQKNESINKNYEKAKKRVKNASDFMFDIIYWEELLDTVRNDKVFEKYFNF
ncbi:MAG: hypothetical protein IKJ41_03465 [Clostridia bacterium]|nr:hypothetical protein [Clostridia bacterium]